MQAQHHFGSNKAASRSKQALACCEEAVWRGEADWVRVISGVSYKFVAASTVACVRHRRHRLEHHLLPLASVLLVLPVIILLNLARLHVGADRRIRWSV